MRVGLVCPYSWEHPGGVQAHVRDLAETLIALGHEPSVLAPGDDDADLPTYVVPAGRAVPVRYNGSVARVNFGLISATRVGRWLRDGDFDVLLGPHVFTRAGVLTSEPIEQPAVDVVTDAEREQPDV